MSHTRGPMSGGVTLAFPPVTPMVKLILITLGAAFAIQLFVARFGAERQLFEWIALSRQGLFGRFAFWQLGSYALLHGGLWHLLMNMLGLWMFGGDVERVLGSRQLARYFTVCVIGGGLVYIVLGVMTGNPASVVGASAGVLGLVVAFAVFFPDRPVYLFPLPFPLRARTLAIIFALFNLYGALDSSAQSASMIAFGAHLGGMGLGYLYLQGLVRPGGWQRMFRSSRKRRPFDVINGERGRGRNDPYDIN